MTRLSFALPLLALSISSLSCSETPTNSSGVTLEALVARSMIPVGDSTTLTLRLRNLTSERLTLTFGSSCQIMPYIERVDSGIVYPHGGGFVCLTVVTSLTVQPFSEHTVTHWILGDTTKVPRAGIALPPGSYSAVAVLESNDRHVPKQSQPVAFEIR